MNFQYKRRRLNQISEEKILNELEKVAKHFHYFEFGYREFNEIANISAGVVKKRFGTWGKGIEILRKYLQGRGLNLSPRPYSPNRVYSDKELFDEMERIWDRDHQKQSGKCQNRDLVIRIIKNVLVVGVMRV